MGTTTTERDQKRETDLREGLVAFWEGQAEEQLGHALKSLDFLQATFLDMEQAGSELDPGALVLLLDPLRLVVGDAQRHFHTAARVRLAKMGCPEIPATP